MAFRCLAHNKRNAKAKICIQIHLCVEPNQTKANQNEPNRSEPNRIELSRVELSCVKTASPELKSGDCATFCCAWQTLSVCVCVCVLSNIVYMGLSGLWSPMDSDSHSDSNSEIWILFVRPLVRVSVCPSIPLSICPLVASQSIVQMSKLHLLCASQKLKQIILPIAFWFRMSVTVLLLGGYMPWRWRFRILDSVWGWAIGFIVRPQFMLIFVYLPPAASEIMQCLY